MSKSTIKIISAVFVVALVAWFLLRPSNSSVLKSKEDAAVAEESATSVDAPAAPTGDLPQTGSQTAQPTQPAANPSPVAPAKQPTQPSGLKSFMERENSPTGQQWREKLSAVYKKLDPQTVASLNTLRSAHVQTVENRWMQIEMNKKTDPNMNENLIFDNEMIGIERDYDADVEKLLGRVKFGEALKLREKFNESLRARGDQPIGSQW